MDGLFAVGSMTASQEAGIRDQEARANPEFAHIDRLENNSFETVTPRDDGIQLGPMSKVIDSDVEPPININAAAVATRCTLRKYFNIGLYSFVADTSVGRYCTFSSRCSIGAFHHPTDWLSIHEFQYRDTSEDWGETIHPTHTNLLRTPGPHTTIGNDVWIGDNAVVLRGVTIGDGAIVGAASVVTRDVPPYAIVVGNPARVLRMRFPPEIVERLLELQWWRLDIGEMRGIDFGDVEQAIARLQQIMASREAAASDRQRHTG
ncbi:MAG: antibiotic acetyltransferase [Zetaproteobacteria bacterium]|nr:MAG: antibiotic acetyltransferase [Zetaproteobacteria bacterium]